MSDYYLGEIRLFPYRGGIVPVDFVVCDGQKLSIQQYQALFSLLGTTYGGDGVTTFGVPDLRGRVPVHEGVIAGDLPATTYVRGQTGGSDAVALGVDNTPVHSHSFSATTTQGTSLEPSSAMTYAAVQSGYRLYTKAGQSGTATTFGAETVQMAYGPGTPHLNWQPSCCLTYAIAVNALYPQ